MPVAVIQGAQVGSILIGGVEMAQVTAVKMFELSFGITDYVGIAKLLVFGDPATLNDQLELNMPVEIWEGTGEPTAPSLFGEALFGTPLFGILPSLVGRLWTGRLTKKTPMAWRNVRSGTKFTAYLLECRDYTDLLDTTIVSTPVEYVATSDKTIIENLFANDPPAIAIDLSDVTAILDIDVSFDNISLREALSRISARTNGEFYLRPDLKLQYHLLTANPSPFTISDSPDNATGFDGDRANFNFSIDGSQLANRIIVKGKIQDDGSELKVTREDAPSQVTYGIVNAKPIVDRGILTTDEANSVGDVEILRRKGPQVAGSFIIRVPGLAAGQYLEFVKGGSIGLSGSYLVRSMVMRWDSRIYTNWTIEFGQWWKPNLGRSLRKVDQIINNPLPPVANPPGSTPGGGPIDRGCNCATDCCHMKLERDCDNGFQVRMLSLPVMYLKIISGQKEVYRSFYKNRTWQPKELVWSPASSSANSMTTGSEQPEDACFGPAMLAHAGGSAGSQAVMFIEKGQTPIDVTPTGLSGQSLLGAASQVHAGPWYHGGFWWALLRTQVSSTIWYMSVIRSDEVNASTYRPPAGPWTVMGTGPNDGTLFGLTNFSIHYDGDDTITVFGMLFGTDDFQFWDFTLSTGIWSAPYGTVHITGTNDDNGPNGLFKLSDGTRVVFYGKSGAPTKIYFKVYTELGSSWGAEQQFDGAEEDANTYQGGIQDGDTIHALYSSVSAGVGRKWYYRPIVGGSAGTKILLYSGVAGQNELYGGMLVWRGSLIIAVTAPNAGVFGKHRAFHGTGGLPPTAFDDVMVDDSNESVFGGLLGFALDPEPDPTLRGDVVASLGPNGLVVDMINGVPV